MGEFSHGPAWLSRLARSNCCQGRLHQGKFNNHIVLSSMNIVLQLSEVRLSTPPPHPPEGRVTALCGQYWGVPLERIWFFWSLPLNMVYAGFPQPDMVSTIDIPFCFSALNRVRVSNSQLEPTPKLIKRPRSSSPPPPRAPEGTGVARLCRT